MIHHHLPAIRVSASTVSARKIVFDLFHIVQHMKQAVDKVRRTEHRELGAQGNDTLSTAKNPYPSRASLGAVQPLPGAPPGELHAQHKGKA